jgi:hypothetical protein
MNYARTENDNEDENTKIKKKVKGKVMMILGDIDLYNLDLHFQDKVDVIAGELRALRVARELQSIRGYCLCLVFQETDQQIDCIPRNDLRTNALHQIPNR